MVNLSILSVVGVALASTVQHDRQERAATGYAPASARCPKTALVRPATGVSPLETKYITARKAKASVALQQWLASSGANFPTPQTYPAVGLTTSGGGLRALLCGAGVIQAFDSRDSQVSTSGLYQALTYEAGLSGGAWLLSSVSANNWPTITSLKTSLWEAAFNNSLAVPEGTNAATVYPVVVNDLLAKQEAGFPPTLTDAWGRLLSYQLLFGNDGGVSKQVSGLSSLSNYTSHNVPFPIITSLGIKTQDGECLPGPNATQYEFSPYEFGSWDAGVSAFTNIKYLGSSLRKGKPAKKGACITNYDGQGYVLGTSSSLFNEACSDSPNDLSALNNEITPTLAGILDAVHQNSTRDEYAAYPNPFYQYKRSTLVSGQKELYLADGGEALQNNPIWPMLHRPVDVLIVNDNSADTSNNFPNGSEILTTYVQAQSAGLTRMPEIPSVDTFVAQGLASRPTFFGCYSPNTMTIVYLPNVNYTFASNEPTAKLQYSPTETDEMIANGVLIGTYNNNSTWATCLGCGIMKKTGVTLPAACTACFQSYCYN